jgi:hypothetical protein
VKKDLGKMRAAFMRVNKTWKIVAETLEKEDRGFIDPYGFEKLVRNDEKLAPLLNNKLFN